MRQAVTGCVLFVICSIFHSCIPMTEADLILYNGKVVTVDKTFRVCEAVAISGNTILATGNNDKIRKYSGHSTRMVDLGGKCVIPGLIDAHLHPESASVSELDEPIPDLHTIAELLAWIREEASSRGKGKWIVYPKFFPTRMIEMRQPTLAELDNAAPENPVFLNGSFGGMINSSAMKESGFNDKTASPDVLRDPSTGKATGFIRSSAFGLLKIPAKKPLTKEAREAALIAMIKRYNEYGLTSLWSGTGDPGTIRMYQDMAMRNVLTARICQNILLPARRPFSKDNVVGLINAYKIKTGDGDNWVRVGSMKVFLDGGILTGTAYMEEPWGDNASAIFGIKDKTYRGEIAFTKEELKLIVSEANKHGWNFTAHATGEAAVDLLLSVYEEVNAEKPIKGGKFSVIHGNFFNQDAIKKMAAMEICANLQPAWFYKDSEAMDSILGKAKTDIFHPYRTLQDAGIIINGGSDHMVKWDASTSINPYNPFLAMYSMVTRKTERGSIFHPDQALTREEALKAYTINNAYAESQDSVKGSIEPGKLADMAVLSKDLLTCPADSIKDIKALMTILDGKVIYEVK